MAERTLKSPDDRSLDARITLALETAPEANAPSGFAARGAAQAAALTPASLTPRRYGRNVAFVCMALLLGLIAVFAHRAAGASPVWTSVEWIFCAQLALVAVWLRARTFS